MLAALLSLPIIASVGVISIAASHDRGSEAGPATPTTSLFDDEPTPAPDLTPISTQKVTLSPTPSGSPSPSRPPSATPSPHSPGSFTHPGVLVSREQLDRARSQVLAGKEPWKSAYEQMRASPLADLNRVPKPREIVECGSYSKPNLGCSDERRDANAAYTQALLWYITRDRRHADKAIEIMNAWSAVIKAHTNSNAPLQTGFAGANWSRAAEIIKYTDARWPAAQVRRFADMLRGVYFPILIKGSATKNGNWELIMMDAAVGIAVFLDDRASFNRAIGIWRGRVPAYIYLRSDGPLPKAPPGSGIDTRPEIVNYWQGQSTFVDGLAQETCRDFGHTGGGLAAAVHVAETAWHQGLDLYKEMQQRLVAALEFHARYDLGAAVPNWLCGGSVKRGLGPIAEIAYNHYGGQQGISMPQTAAFAQARRPAGEYYFGAWETLTHSSSSASVRLESLVLSMVMATDTIPADLDTTAAEGVGFEPAAP
jgi:hypothetical protein